AIHTHERHPVAALDKKIYPGKHLMIAVTFRDTMTLADDSAARLGLRKLEMYALLLGRNLDSFDPVEFLDPALHLFRLGGLIAEPVDEGLQLRDSLLLIGIRGQELRAPFLLQLFVPGISAGINVQPLIPQFADLVYGDVQEIPVV